MYLLEVNRTNRGPRLILSRSHPHLVRRLFELEVPEVFNGNVEIKAVAREPGYRSKVAVAAKQEGLDPVGSCVGLRGVRIQNVVAELNGERIDVIQWDDDPKRFIAYALSPAQVVSVDIGSDDNTAVVVVPDSQLSLAIGKEGQNARLAARISGWRIDIKSASAVQAVKATVAEKAEVGGAEVVEAAADADGQDAVGLSEVGLSTRALRLLEGAAVTRVGQVLRMSDKELLEVKGFGPKALVEVRERLAAFLAAARPVEIVEEAPARVEPVVEEGMGAPEEVPAAVEVEEEEVVLYQAPEVVVEAEGKPVIRFAEDIFGVREAAVVVDTRKGKKKKKKSREERQDESRPMKAKKVRGAVAVDDGVDDGVDDEVDEAVDAAVDEAVDAAVDEPVDKDIGDAE
jgi:transcription antitermination factor NusA-like protein